MKRFMTAILALSMLLSSIPTSAAPKTDSPYVVRFSHDVTEKELLSADVVDADFTLAKENAEYLKQLIDAGKILYCSEPELPCEALAETLGIPMSRKAYYLPELLTAYSIYKSGGQYVFEQHYAQFTDIVTKDVKKSGDFGECITVKQFRLDPPSLSAMSFANYAAAYTSFKEDCAFASGVKSSDDPLEGGSLGNQLFSYTMNVYNSTGHALRLC
ncbi:MAG: hypothetical protein IJR95_09255 [Lachnospiraceae bacterium]|nr:hypothetical protein [Lachnospiraceae bacterium]